MLQTDIDSLLKTEEFKETIRKADLIAEGTGRNSWPVRISLIALLHGAPIARRYVSRRAGYKNSPGWHAYQRLCLEGIIHGGCLYWTDEEEDTVWGRDPHLWLFQMIDIAGGGPTPDDYPRYSLGEMRERDSHVSN